MFNIKNKISSLFGSSKPEQVPQKQKSSDKEVLNRFKKGEFTLDDFVQQLGMMDKMGSIAKMARFVPGMKGVNITPEQLERGKQELKRLQAMVKVMTVAERQNPALLTKSRKEQISRESGISVSDMEVMLARFEESKQFVKLYMKKGRF